MRQGAKPTKPKTGAKQAVARRSQENEDSRVRDLERRLAEALEREAEALKRESEALDQQRTTAEILRVISRSPTDVQPVFEAIAESSVRLGAGRDCTVYRFDGELIHIAAHHNVGAEGRDEMRRAYPMRPSSARSLTARAIDTRSIVHSPDYESDPNVDEAARQRARRMGYRTGIAVPMVRGGAPHRMHHRRAVRCRRRPTPLHGQRDRVAPDVRRPGGDCHRERAAIPRDPRQEPAARSGQPPQVRVPGQHVPRAPYAR